MRRGKSFRERLHKARKTVAIITPDEAKRRLDGGGVTLIDVDEEWQAPRARDDGWRAQYARRAGN